MILGFPVMFIGENHQYANRIFRKEILYLVCSKTKQLQVDLICQYGRIPSVHVRISADKAMENICKFEIPTEIVRDVVRWCPVKRFRVKWEHWHCFVLFLVDNREHIVTSDGT